MLVFHLQVPYSTPSRALLKTTMGMLGEYEYDTVYNENEVPPVTWVLYVAFLVTNCIIIMNLLVSEGMRVTNQRIRAANCMVKRLLQIPKILPKCKTFLVKMSFNRPIQLVCFIFPIESQGSLILCFFINYAYICTRITCNLKKRTVLQSIIT